MDAATEAAMLFLASFTTAALPATSPEKRPKHDVRELKKPMTLFPKSTGESHQRAP